MFHFAEAMFHFTNFVCNVLIFIFFLAGSIWAESNTRFIDGKIQFATAVVNGKVCWTLAEKDAAIAEYDIMVKVGTDTAQAPITYYNATKYEIWAATASGKLNNYDDFKNLTTNKDTLFRQMKTIKQDHDLALELNDTQKINEHKQKFNSLKEIRDSIQ